MWWLDGCNILCLLIQQATFFIHAYYRDSVFVLPSSQNASPPSLNGCFPPSLQDSPGDVILSARPTLVSLPTPAYPVPLLRFNFLHCSFHPLICLHTFNTPSHCPFPLHASGDPQFLRWIFRIHTPFPPHPSWCPWLALNNCEHGYTLPAHHCLFFLTQSNSQSAIHAAKCYYNKDSTSTLICHIRLWISL